MSPAQFTDLMNQNKDRIIHFYGEEEFEGVSTLHNSFREFKRACNTDRGLKKILEDNRNAQPHRDFNESWKHIPERFRLLRLFFSGFASIFPNTATVESDFSIMAYEKSANRQRLADISLSGIMHAKQRKEITNMPIAVAEA